MGQVHWDEVTLDRLLDMSDWVAIARPADPSFEEVRVPIDEPTWDGEPCPPFVYRRQRYIVDEMLLGETDGDCIIDPADLDWRQRMHRDYYVTGLDRSPVHARTGWTRPEGDGPRLVFATHEKGRLAFPVAQAQAPLEQLDDVRERIRGRMKTWVLYDGL